MQAYQAGVISGQFGCALIYHWLQTDEVWGGGILNPFNFAKNLYKSCWDVPEDSSFHDFHRNKFRWYYDEFSVYLINLMYKNKLFIHLYHKLRADTSRIVECGEGWRLVCAVSELCQVIFTASFSILHFKNVFQINISIYTMFSKRWGGGGGGFFCTQT
jgi:hypothetical protein